MVFHIMGAAAQADGTDMAGNEATCTLQCFPTRHDITNDTCRVSPERLLMLESRGVYDQACRLYADQHWRRGRLQCNEHANHVPYVHSSHGANHVGNQHSDSQSPVCTGLLLTRLSVYLATILTFTYPQGHAPARASCASYLPHAVTCTPYLEPWRGTD